MIVLCIVLSVLLLTVPVGTYFLGVHRQKKFFNKKYGDMRVIRKSDLKIVSLIESNPGARERFQKIFKKSLDKL